MSNQLGEYFGQGIPTPPEKVSEIKELVSSLDYVGVEIEMEEAGRWPRLSLWHRGGDGSLRNNGMEIKFLSPYRGANVIKALEELRAAVADGASAIFNDRCSMHVHIDVRDLTIDQLRVLITNYVYFEPHMLAQIIPPTRRSNNFCVPYSQSSHKIATLGRMFHRETARELHNVIDNVCSKYDALNLQSIASFGSVEFRVFSGTFDYDTVLRQINLCLSFKDMARKGIVPLYSNRMALTDIHRLYLRKAFARHVSIYGDPPLGPSPQDLIIKGFTNVNLLHVPSETMIPRSKTEGMLQRALKNKILREGHRDTPKKKRLGGGIEHLLDIERQRAEARRRHVMNWDSVAAQTPAATLSRSIDDEIFNQVLNERPRQVPEPPPAVPPIPRPRRRED